MNYLEQKTYIAALYARLSSEDLQEGTSVSIETQKKILEDYCKSNGIIIYNGDLTITSNCSSDIPFKGLIVVTGNLTIDGDVKITTDKDTTANIVISNYLGTEYVYTVYIHIHIHIHYVVHTIYIYYVYIH